MIFRYKTLKEKLTKENAREIYYYSNCFLTDEIDFYHENFTNEDFLKWNDEYINKELDICESYFNEEIGFITLIKHVQKCSDFVDVFTNNKETYIRIIKYLKRLYSEYGYFISYLYDDPFGRDFDWGPSFFMKFLRIYLWNINESEFKNKKIYFEDVSYFYPEYLNFGLIHNINMCGFKDVLDDLFTNIVLPLFENYHKQDFFENYKIKYIDNKNGLKGYGLYRLLKEYILKFDIDAPKRLKEILEIE